MSALALRLTERTPAAPGPGPMSEALLRALDLTVRRRVESLLPGEHRSTALGIGTELAQIRLYVPGDDVRRIDWNVTARTGEPHVRVDVAERALTTWIVLDVSASMIFGTADRRKADVAEGVALAVGHLASRRGSRLGVVTWGDGEVETVPPRRGRPGMLGLLVALRREQERRGSHCSTLDDALARTARIARRGAAVFVISDFRGQEGIAAPLARLAARCHTVCAEIRDPREQELVDVGDLWLVDPETGRQLRVDTSSERLRRRFAERAAAERDALAATILGAGAEHLVLSTEGDWLRAFAGQFRRRGSRR